MGSNRERFLINYHIISDVCIILVKNIVRQRISASGILQCYVGEVHLSSSRVVNVIAPHVGSG